MVQRSDTGSLTPAFDRARPLRRMDRVARGVPADPGIEGATPVRKGLVAWNALILIVFFASLMIPGMFTVAGVTLTPPRLLLLIGIVPLGYCWLRGDAGRVTGVDILFFMSCLWIWIALTVNHGLSFVPRAAIFFIELFGGYLLGRMLIRNAEDYRMFFRYFFYTLVFLLPFVIIEALTRTNILRQIFDTVLSIPPRQENLRRRLGLIRAQGPFDHPILLGIYCSIGVANFFFVFGERIGRRVLGAVFALFMVLTSISSGPVIAAGLQIAMIGWDTILGFLKARWVVLTVLVLVLVAVMRVAAEFDFLGLIIQNLTFDPQTGEGRLVIIEYGLASVMRDPVFGIGASDWVRPYWKHATLDNFWLLMAMRYGIPCVFLLVLAIGFHCLRMFRAPGLDAQAQRFRSGYLIALAGLVVVLGTVYVWGGPFIFIMAYLGAGAWIYTPGTTPEPTPAMARRARIQAGAEAALAPPADEPPAAPPAAGGRVRPYRSSSAEDRLIRRQAASRRPDRRS